MSKEKLDIIYQQINQQMNELLKAYNIERSVLDRRAREIIESIEYNTFDDLHDAERALKRRCQDIYQEIHGEDGEREFEFNCKIGDDFYIAKCSVISNRYDKQFYYADGCDVSFSKIEAPKT